MTLRHSATIITAATLVSLAVAGCAQVETAETVATELVEAGFPEAEGMGPSRIAGLMKDNGYRAKIEITVEDGVNNYTIVSGAGGSDFWIEFYDCTDMAENCEKMRFYVGYSFEGERPDTKMLLDTLNVWNFERFSKAFMDPEDDPFIEFTVISSHGISDANFIEVLEWFNKESGTFETAIGWESDDTIGSTETVAEEIIPT